MFLSFQEHVKPGDDYLVKNEMIGGQSYKEVGLFSENSVPTSVKAEGHRAPGQEKNKGGGTKWVLEFPRDVKKWTTLANFRFVTHYGK